MKRIVFFLVLGLIGLNTGFGQIMPSNAAVILNPPSPVFLSDYYSIGSNSLQCVLNFTDFSEPSWDVRLKLTIESADLKISTSNNFKPVSPINVSPGVPLTLTGPEFYEYLAVQNLDLQGITAASLNQSGKLPEGLYEFCVEILDYETGIPLSLPGCATAYLFSEPPPVLLKPVCEDVVLPNNPQNIYFEWQIAGGASPQISLTSLYKLFVYEVTDENVDPYFAVQNNNALLVYESDFMNQTSQTMDFTTTLLTAGKKYVWRVRAVDEDEQDIYGNNGHSEWCWFYYGYPSDGILVLNAPADELVFGKLDQKVFAWETSDKAVAGQSFDYTIFIYEMLEDQSPEEAVQNNVSVFDYTQPVTTSTYGSTYLLTETLEPGKQFAWQVVANTEEQEVAKSTVQSFYTPPLIEKLLAGSNILDIVQLNGNDLNNLSGTCRIPMSQDPEDYVEVDFENISVNQAGDLNIMIGGTILFDLADLDPLELMPNYADNGSAFFNYKQGRVTSAGISYYGNIEWPLPHPTTDLEGAKVKTVDKWFSANSSFQLSGTAQLAEGNDFDLLDPMDFEINLLTNSQIQLSANTYSLALLGSVFVNDNVKTNDGNQYGFSFTQQEQLSYFEVTNLLGSAPNYLFPVDQFKMAFMPVNAIVDLSESVSPGKLSIQTDWKGIYFPNFKVRFFTSSFDGSNQLSLPQTVDKMEDLEDDFEFWIQGQGLHLVYDWIIDDLDETKFNDFKTAFAGNLNVDNSEVSESTVEGKIKIPFVDLDAEFTFTVPVENQGLQLGYLDDDITMRDVVVNPFGGENRVNITLNRAVFAENNRLELEIDAELLGLNTTIYGIEDFRVYGDNSIGVGSKNGSKKLNSSVAGDYNGYNAFVTDVGASLVDGKYVFSYIAEMDLGDDVVGEDGPPLLAVSSVTSAGDDTEMPSGSQPSPAIAVPDVTESSGDQKLTSVEMFIGVNNSIVDIEGYLKLRSDDPVWGNSFAGGINGKIKVPTEIQAGANMILGDKDGLKFWYFDAWFNDTEGMGISVAPLFNITAMEGRIYHHMSMSDGAFAIDPDIAFGGALYLQIIDPSGGQLFASDIGAELEVFEDGEFILNMSGDVSVINESSRTAGAGGIASAVGEQLAEAALEAVGPLSLTVDVAGGELTIEAENLKAGSISYQKDDFTIGLGADVSNLPSVDFSFEKGATNFSIAADAAGKFDLGIGYDGNNIGLGIDATSGGYLNVDLGGAALAAEINRMTKTGSLSFSYGEQAIGIGVQEDGGYLNLQFSEDKSFAAGYSSAGSAFIGLEYDGNSFNLSGDQGSKSGALDIGLPDFNLGLAANVEEASASLSIEAAGTTVNISGQKDVGGEFHVATGDVSVDIEADIENGTGSLGFEFDGGNKAFYAGLQEGGQGALNFKNGNQEFGIAGNTSGTAGSVRYKDNNADFTIAADKDNQTGSVDLAFDNKELSALVSPDSSGIHIGFDAIELDVASNNSSSGMISVKSGADVIRVEADLEEKSGSLLLSDGTNSIYAAGSANATGEVAITIDNNTVEGSLTEDSCALFIGSGGFEFSVSGNKEGSGVLSLKDGDIETRLGVSIPEEAGEIYVANGEDFIHVKGNKSENKGLIDIKQSMVAFKAELDDSLTMETGPFSLTRYSDGNGYMEYSDGGDGIGVYKEEEMLGLGINYDGNALFLAHGLSSSYDSVYFDGQGQRVSASIEDNSGKVAFQNASISVAMGANTDGQGNIAVSSGDVAVAVSGDMDNSSGSFEFEKGDLKLSGGAQISDKAFDIGFEQGNIISNVEYAPNLQKMSYAQTGDFSIAAEKENDRYETIFSKDGHTVRGTVSNSLKEIEYQGMGAVVILGNEREYVSYGGHSVRIQDKKVYVDEQEVQDFSNVSLTTDIDFSNLHYPNLDLSSVDFSGIDFSGIDISNIDFSGLDFTNIDLSSIDFTGVDFGQLDLSGIDFTGVDLSGLDISGIDFSNFSFNGIDLSGLDFTGIDLSGISLAGLDFTGIDLSMIDLSTINFTGFDFIGIDLSGIDLSALGNFNMADLPTLDLSGIDFSGLDFGNVDLSMIDFTGINLSGINLAGLNFTGFDFGSIDLSMIDFTGIDFSGISLAGLNFSGIDFGNLDLSMINFSGLSFPNVDLSGIDFTGIDLSSIDLSMIDFSGFDFSGIDLSAFDFSGISFPSIPDVNWSEIYQFDDIQIKPYLNGANSSISFIKGVDSVHIKSLDMVDGSVLCFVSGETIEIEKTGSAYHLSYNEYKASLEDNKDLTISKGPAYQLHLTPTEGSINYENYAVALSETDGFQYNDGLNNVAINDAGISFGTGDKQLSYTNDQELFVQYDVNKNFRIHPQNGLEVNYDGKALGISSEELSYADEGRTYVITPNSLSLTEGDKQLEISESRAYLAIDGQNSLEYASNTLTAIHADKTFTLSTEMEISYSDPNNALAVSQSGMSLSADGKSVSLSPDEIEIVLANDKQLKISNDLLEFKYELNEIKLGSTALYFSDGSQTIDLGQDQLMLSKDDNSIFLSPTGFGLNYGGDKYLNIDKESQKVDFKYDDIIASFSNGEALSFSDGTRSFALSSSGLEMADGDKSIAVIDDNGLPGIRLESGADLFELSQSGFALEYAGKRYAVNETEFLNVEIDETRKIEVMNNGVKYIDGSFEFAIGGDENFIELKEGSTSIALSQDEKLVLKDGIYSASLSKDLVVEMSDGTRTIKLLEEDYYLNYLQGDYQFGIRGANGAKPGVDFSNGEYSFFVEGEKNADVTVGVSSQSFGAISASVNSEKDVSVVLEQSEETAYGFLVDNGKLHLINGTPAEPPVPEHLDNAPEIPAQDGPQHLTNSIAEDAGGKIRGEANIYFDSKNSHFMMNAAVAGNDPVCISGAMGLEISPGEFHLDLGTEEQRVEVFPTCSGFGGGGWLGIHNSELDIGLFAAWRASASIEVGSDFCGAGLSAEAGAELGVKANMDLDPFRINSAGVWVELYAGIYARYWCMGGSGSITIAEARLRGDLTVYFESDTRIVGNLSGSIVILDIISADFDMGFDTTL